MRWPSRSLPEAATSTVAVWFSLEKMRLAMVSVPESDFFSAKNKKNSLIFSTEIWRNFCETFLLGQS
jgi:hypothetical protein